MKLEPQQIASTALDVLDEVGLDELSMRRLASALGVQNPALYWHVKNKQELLDRMAQLLLAEGFAAMKSAKTWDGKVEQLGRGLRHAMRSRRDGARVIAGANLTPEVSGLPARMNDLVAAMTEAGIDATTALGGVLAVIHYTLGATLEEQADPRTGEPTMQIDPALTALAAVKLAGSRVDARYDLGLSLLLDGLRARLSPRPRSPARRAARRA